MGITHSKVSAVSDGADTGLVRPSDWNAEHAFSSWQAYTPTWSSDGTAPTIGNGTLSGRYRMLSSDMMLLYVRWIRGSTSTNGTGTYTLTIPSGYNAANNGQYNLMSGRLLDSGTAHYVAVGIPNPGGTTINVVVADGSNPRLWSATVPVTPATNDEVNLEGILEVVAV